MRTVLVTGGNRGIGRETVRQLVGRGHTVYLGARDPGQAERVAAELGARPLVLDVLSDESVRRAAATVAEWSGRLDVLVNNAGVFGPASVAEEITAADLREIFDTNVFGVVRGMHAFLPLLRNSGTPVVVNVSSGLGSIAVAGDPAAHAELVPVWVPGLAYASSKAALNMITVQYAHAFERARINAVDPGYTDSGSMERPGARSVADGAEIIVRMAEVGPDGPTGGFFTAEGRLPW